MMLGTGVCVDRGRCQIFEDMNNRRPGAGKHEGTEDKEPNPEGSWLMIPCSHLSCNTSFDLKGSPGEVTALLNVPRTRSRTTSREYVAGSDLERLARAGSAANGNGAALPHRMAPRCRSQWCGTGAQNWKGVEQWGIMKVYGP